MDYRRIETQSEDFAEDERIVSRTYYRQDRSGNGNLFQVER